MDVLGIGKSRDELNKELQERIDKIVEKIINKIFEDKNNELQRESKIGNFTICALTIFAFFVWHLIFAITRSSVITGALFLFTGMAFLVWFNSNIRKEDLFRPEFLIISNLLPHFPSYVLH